MFGDGAISWRSKKQETVSQCTVAAEYIALVFAVRKALWFKYFSKPIGILMKTIRIRIKEDNQGCISLTKDTVINNSSKRIDIKYKNIIDSIRCGNIAVAHDVTSEMVAYALTKA